MKKFSRKNKFINIIMSIVMVLLTAFSACSAYFMFDYKDKFEKQEQISNQQKDENDVLQREKDSLQTEIGKLEQDKIDLREEQLALEEQKTVLLGEKEELISERNVLQAQVESITISESQLKAEKTLLENAIVGLNETVESLEEENATLKESESQLKTENATLTNNVALLTAQKSDLQKEYDKLVENEVKLQTDKEELQEQINGLNGQIETLESEKEVLQEREDLLTQEKANLEDELQTVRVEKEELQEQFDSLSSSSNQEQAQLSARITELEKAQEDLQAEYDALVESEAQLKEQKQQLETNLEAISQEKEDLQAEYEESLEREDALKTEKQTLESQITTLNERIATLIEEKEELVSRENALKEEKQTLENELHSVKDEKAELLESYNTVVASETALRQEKESLTSQLETLENEKDEIQDQYDALVIRKNQLDQEYEAVRSELAQLQTKYDALLAQISLGKELPVDAGRVVLMIGDGLNEEAIENAEIRLDDDLYVKSFATNGHVSLSEGENAEDAYVSLIADAKSKGMGVAFITTDVLFNDTAKKFTAPSAAEDDIQAVFNEQIASTFDLIFGADYYQETSYIYSSQKASIEGAGYKFIDNLNYKTVNKYYNGNLEGTYALEAEKLFGAFVNVRDSEYSAIQDNAKTITEPSLGQMTEIAIKYMDINFPCGYLLIVENDQIDDYKQAGDEVGQATAVVELDRCAKIVRKSFNDKKLEYNLIMTGDSNEANSVPYFVDGVKCELEESTDATKMKNFISSTFKQATEEKVEKVLMAIGDGMGAMHMNCAHGYLDDGEYLNMEQFSYSGVADALSLTEGKAADSAAGGTALATGVRVQNGYLSMDSDGNNIQTIAEMYKAKGMGVGIISTDFLFEATPAAFYSHTNSRYNFEDIRTQQYASNFDLFLGADMYSEKLLANANGFYLEYTTPSELPEGYVAPELTSGYVYALEQQKIKDAGYTYFTDMGKGKVDMSSEKLFGAFPAISHSTFDAPLDSADTNTAPSITQMVAFAIEWMELHYGDKGYFIMFEENYIDIYSELHNDNGKVLSYETGDAMKSLFELDRAIGKARELLNETGDNYVMVVSADHSTGGFAESTNRDNNFGFWTSYHDQGNVPYFIDIKCPKQSIQNVPTQLYVDGSYKPILNTDLCNFLKTLIV